MRWGCPFSDGVDPAIAAPHNAGYQPPNNKLPSPAFRERGGVKETPPFHPQETSTCKQSQSIDGLFGPCCGDPQGSLQ